MVIPSFFSWMQRKYPKVIKECAGQKTVDEDGHLITVDTSLPNPNGVEFDNLYLTLDAVIRIAIAARLNNNVIVKSYHEAMTAVLEYIDTLFRIVRPRKLLYIAVNGVSPSAKTSQLRSSRFFIAKKSHERNKEVSRIRCELEAKGARLPSAENFDAIYLTAGTALMEQTTQCLQHYIHDRLNNDPGWKGIKVILSDASVPGEAEHKIIDYIRRQRAQPDYDSNSQHVVAGNVAETIMLGLTTHDEPNFTVISEKVQPKKTYPCDVCGQPGHEMKDCTGDVPDAPQVHSKLTPGDHNSFIFVHLAVLREYLERELWMPNLPFPYDFERALNDWVFMCFIVGNAYLPHLPSLDIRSLALETLFHVHKGCVFKTRGWITDSDTVNLERLEVFMMELGQKEDEMFNKLRQNALYWRTRSATYTSQAALDDEDRDDEVRFWEEGYKERYYKSRFEVTGDDMEFRRQVVEQYVRGLCWMQRYYFQGCADWRWHFPYCHAPFASDFKNISGLTIDFQKGTQPLKPLEFLMAMLPVYNSQYVPKSWARLMTDPSSPIKNFYPEELKVSPSSIKSSNYGFSRQPHIDEDHLLKVLELHYKDLPPDEIKRNIHGHDHLFVSPGNKSYEYLVGLYQEAGPQLQALIHQGQRYPYRCEGVRGEVMLSDDNVGIGGQLSSPVVGLQPVVGNRAVCVRFQDPQYPEDFVFPARRLKSAVEPPRVLSPDETRPYQPYNVQHRGATTWDSASRSNQGYKRSENGHGSSDRFGSQGYKRPGYGNDRGQSNQWYQRQNLGYGGYQNKNRENQQSWRQK